MMPLPSMQESMRVGAQVGGVLCPGVNQGSVVLLELGNASCDAEAEDRPRTGKDRPMIG